MAEETEGQLEEGQVSITTTEAWAGPLPPPAVLKSYEDILHGSTERILTNFENESQHRRQLEKQASDSDSLRSMVGLIAGCVVALLLIGVATLCVLNGYAWQAVAILGVELAAAVSVFVKGSRSGD